MPKTIIVILIIVIVGAGAYFLGTKNLFVQTPPASVPIPSPASNAASPSPSPLGSPEPSAQAASASPSATLNPALLENIKASVVSKNTAALEGYMTDTVIVTIEATECCGSMTKVKAINEMDYILDAA